MVSLLLILLWITLLFLWLVGAFLDDADYGYISNTSAALIFSWIVCFAATLIPVEDKTPWDQLLQIIPIVALQDNPWMNIRWWWFISVSITTEWTQRYYYAVNNWEYYTVNYIEWVWEKVRIYYSDKIPVIEERWPDEHWFHISQRPSYYKIIVPEWTVANTYNVDLK